MSFVQIITYRTEKRGEMADALARWMEDTQDVRRSRRRILLKDRETEGRYVEVVFFDSYEDAMHNSTLPATGALSESIAVLADELHFENLDLLEDGI